MFAIQVDGRAIGIKLAICKHMADNTTMSGPSLVDGGPPATDAAITKLESVLGHRLPAAYRRFLLAHNGGRPIPESFARDGKPFSILSVFFSVGARDSFYDLAVQFRTTRKDMPAEVMPVALDLGGNLICLAIKGKNRGKVYFWDHEGGVEIDDLQARYPELILNPPDEAESSGPHYWPGHTDLWLIADSFAEFLDSFHDFELEDEQAPTKPAGKQPAKAKSTKSRPTGKPPGKTKPAAKPRKTRKP